MTSSIKSLAIASTIIAFAAVDANAQAKPAVSEMRTASAAPRVVKTPSMWIRTTSHGSATAPEHLDSITYVAQGHATQDLTVARTVRIFKGAGLADAAIKQALATHAPLAQIAFNTTDNKGAAHVVLLSDAVITGSKSVSPTLQETVVTFRTVLVDGKPPKKNTTDSWNANR